MKWAGSSMWSYVDGQQNEGDEGLYTIKDIEVFRITRQGQEYASLMHGHFHHSRSGLGHQITTDNTHNCVGVCELDIHTPVCHCIRTHRCVNKSSEWSMATAAHDVVQLMMYVHKMINKLIA